MTQTAALKPRNHHRPQGRSLTRRRFIQASAVAGSQAVLLQTAQAAATNLEAYASATSLDAGETLRFFARDPQLLGSSSLAYPLKVVRLGWPDTTVFNSTVTLFNRAVPADASANGCRWPVSYQLTVPKAWPSGLYYAEFGAGANACSVPFVVTAKRVSSKLKTMLLVPVNTVQAYNEYGGKSLYDYNSSGGVRGAKVSFDRPLTQPFNRFFDVWTQYLVRWMAKNRIEADFCTDIDLHADKNLLDNYRLLVQAGHDEYWTAAMRKRVDDFVADGGNVAFLGGNTCWFQARLESGGGVADRTLVCYKTAAADPEPQAALKTTTWHELAPSRPENTTTGLSFLKGCSWASAVYPRPSTPYVVQRPEHWVFAGTGLAQGAGFGQGYVGYEADAADFRMGSDNRPYPTGLDGSPATLRILAQADASNWNDLSLAASGGLSGELSGHCALAIFTRGGQAGTVFNAGSTDWSYGLRPELDGQAPTPISRITLNVLSKLATDGSESVDVRRFSSSTGPSPVNAFYTTQTAGLPGMALDGLAFRAFARCESGMLPVYRYRSRNAGPAGTRSRLSTNPFLDLAGQTWVKENTPAFYAYALPRQGATAVYGYSAADTGGLRAYQYSTSGTAPAGFTATGIEFYAPTA